MKRTMKVVVIGLLVVALVMACKTEAEQPADTNGNTNSNGDNGNGNGDNGNGGNTEKPALTGNVTITGTTKVGHALSAAYSGGNGTGTKTWQWVRDTSDISGATNESYTLVPADKGQQIKVRVICSGNTGSLTSNPTPAITQDQAKGVAIDGKSLIGGTLNAVVSGGTGSNYVWTFDGDATSRGTLASYNVTVADIEKKLKVTVSIDGTSFTATTDAAVPKPKLTVEVDGLDGGKAYINRTLTLKPVVTDIVGTPSYTYEWEADGAPFGAGAASVKLVKEQENKTITGSLTAMHAGWTAKADGQISSDSAKYKNLAAAYESYGCIAMENHSSRTDASLSGIILDFIDAYISKTFKNPNIAKFANVKVVFADKIPDLDGHRSEKKDNGTGNKPDLVIYIDPVLFAQETVGYTAAGKRNAAANWLQSEIIIRGTNLGTGSETN